MVLTQALYEIITIEESNDPPRDYLMPLGDTGFWVTPMDAADPFDCERYPRSPYCTQELDPFTFSNQTPWETDFGFSRSPCDFCLDIEPSIFGLPLPDYSVCYRQGGSGCNPPPGGDDGGGGYSGGPTGDPYPPGCVRNLRFLIYIPSRLPQPNQPLPEPRAVLHTTPEAFLYPASGISYTVATADGTIVPIQAAIVTTRSPNGVVEETTCYFPQSYPGYPQPLFLGARLQANQPETCTYNQFPPPPPPFPPSGNRRNDDMCDCQEQTELLRVIARRLGVQDYPVKVPKSLNKLGGTDNQDIQSLTQFQFWMAYQLDGLLGEFPIEIDIEDNDPTQAGNQGVRVKLPNVAETLAEIYGLMAKTSTSSDIHTNFFMRIVAEMIATKNTGLITQDYVKAMTDFMGFSGNPKRRKIPYSFNVANLESLEGLLESSTQEIEGWENTDKTSLTDYLQRLMYAASIIKAVHLRKGGDVARTMAEIARALGRSPEEDAANDAWENFIDAVDDPNSNFNRNSPTKPNIVDGGRVSGVQINLPNYPNNNTGGGGGGGFQGGGR